MLVESFSVRKQALDLVLTGVSGSPQGILEESLGHVRKVLEESDPPGVAKGADYGITAGTQRRSAMGLIWPVHWWSNCSTIGMCDFEGDLDFTPLVLDRTLIGLRGNFEVRDGEPLSAVEVARLGQLTLHAFLEGLTQ